MSGYLTAIDAFRMLAEAWHFHGASNFGNDAAFFRARSSFEYAGDDSEPIREIELRISYALDFEDFIERFWLEYL